MDKDNPNACHGTQKLGETDGARTSKSPNEIDGPHSLTPLSGKAASRVTKKISRKRSSKQKQQAAMLNFEKRDIYQPRKKHSKLSLTKNRKRKLLEKDKAASEEKRPCRR